MPAAFARSASSAPARLARVGFAERAQLGLEPGDGGERAAGDVVDELRGEAAVGAEHGDARAVGGARDLRAHAAAALEAALLLGEDGHARLPTLRCTYSPS